MQRRSLAPSQVHKRTIVEVEPETRSGRKKSKAHQKENKNVETKPNLPLPPSSHVSFINYNYPYRVKTMHLFQFSF